MDRGEKLTSLAEVITECNTLDACKQSLTVIGVKNTIFSSKNLNAYNFRSA